jgi:hypothetical protein
MTLYVAVIILPHNLGLSVLFPPHHCPTGNICCPWHQTQSSRTHRGDSLVIGFKESMHSSMDLDAWTILKNLMQLNFTVRASSWFDGHECFWTMCTDPPSVSSLVYFVGSPDSFPISVTGDCSQSGICFRSGDYSAIVYADDGLVYAASEHSQQIDGLQKFRTSSFWGAITPHASR